MHTTSALASPMPQSLSIPNRLFTVLVCAATGLLGGLALMPAAHATLVTGPVLGVLYGLLFALLFSNRATSAGSGLLWGLGFALLLWLAVVTVILQLANAGVTSLDQLRTNRDNFPDLVGYILCFGAPLGLVLGTFQARKTDDELAPFSAGRAIVGGTLAGIVGGWAFGKWMEQVNFYPLIAGLVGSNSRMLGESLHFLFAIIIGVTSRSCFSAKRAVTDPAWPAAWPMASFGGFWDRSPSCRCGRAVHWIGPVVMRASCSDRSLGTLCMA